MATKAESIWMGTYILDSLSSIYWLCVTGLGVALAAWLAHTSIVVLGDRAANGSRILFKDVISEACEVRFLKDILVSDSPEVHPSDVSVSVLNLDKPDLKRTVSFPKNVLWKSMATYPRLTPFFAFPFLAVQKLANFNIQWKVRQGTQSPHDLCAIGCRPAEISNRHSPWTLEHVLNGAIFHRPLGHIIGKIAPPWRSEKWSWDQVGAFRSPSGFLRANHEEPRCNDKGQCEKNKANVSDFYFPANNFFKVLILFVAGAAVAMMGPFLLQRNFPTVVCIMILCAGLAVASCSPLIVHRLWADIGTQNERDKSGRQECQSDCARKSCIDGPAVFCGRQHALTDFL